MSTIALRSYFPKTNQINKNIAIKTTLLHDIRMLKKTKILLIGAGPAGLTAALRLTQTGIYDVTLVEGDSTVGGMSKTISLWNFKVDLGPHRFFSFDPEVNAFWHEVVGNDYEVVRRLTRIYFNKKFFFYPLKILNVFQNLGLWETLLCTLSYAYAKVSPDSNESQFEGWVINRFGKRLYRFFFKSYSEKLWGISCRQLDSDFARQRIKKLSFFEAVRDSVQTRRLSKHKSLIDIFHYPLGGTGVLYQKMANEILKNGGKLQLDTKVSKIIIDSSRVSGVELSDGRLIQVDLVISTMPLTHLVSAIGNVPKEVINAASRLRFRNTILVYLLVDDDALFSDQWLYMHSEDIKTGRITNYRNWSPSLFKEEKNTVLSLEYWCFEEDPIWKMSDVDLINIAKNDLVKAELTKRKTILDGRIVRIPNCYPVYQAGFRENLEVIKDFVRDISGLTAIGRGGAFKYNNQDHSILMGLLAAKNVAGAQLDLWSINNDYEYQEERPIKE